METKKCPACQQVLPVSSFGKHSKEACGLFWICKKCRSDKRRGKRKGEHWKSYLVRKELTISDQRRYLSVRYNVLCQRVKTKKSYIGRGTIVEIEREEFINFSIKDRCFKKLFRAWVLSGYKPRLIPTVDRIDNNGNYSLRNIQYLTMVDNTKKGRK